MNRAQIRAMLIRAHVEIDIWGRGTGKTDGVIAERAHHNARVMPRSKGIFIVPTYEHGLTNTLPGVIEMWSRMGYRRDIHFFIGRKPPKAWGWADAYSAPLSPKHSIFWFDGSCQVLVSQDRAENAAGPSVDYIIGDEAKHLDHPKLLETFQTNRGNRQYFGKRSEHHSLVFTTDMPTSPKSKWLFEYEQYMDEEAVEIILAIQHEILLLNASMPKASRTKAAKIHRAIDKYQAQLNDIRMGDPDNGQDALTYFSECSTLENLEIVGEDYIRQQKRTLTQMKYRTSILGERMTKIEGGFYPLLDEDRHYYTKTNYSHLDSLEFDFSRIKNRDCRFDADVDLASPLEIALDYNAKINSLVVGQESGLEFLFLNSLYVEPPLRLGAVVEKFVKYYRFHKTKEVVFYYDHTAIGENALTDYSFADEVYNVLNKHGWNVTMVYIGQAPSHAYKYNYWGIAMQGDSPLPMPKFNRTNCGSLLKSMENADARQGPSGFEKDKTPERRKDVPPNEATHLSDAGDTLYIGKYAGTLTEEEGFEENTFI